MWNPKCCTLRKSDLLVKRPISADLAPYGPWALHSAPSNAPRSSLYSTQIHLAKQRSKGCNALAMQGVAVRQTEEYSRAISMGGVRTVLLSYQRGPAFLLSAARWRFAVFLLPTARFPRFMCLENVSAHSIVVLPDGPQKNLPHFCIKPP